MTATKPTRRQTTVRIGGKRMRIVTRDGRVTQQAAPVLEWELQAAGVKAMRAMPEYVDDADNVKPGTFTLAGDMNAARRSMNEAAKAKATGLTPGEHDKRLYMWPAGTRGGVLGLIEYKAAKTPVSKDQRARHALLAALGFTRQAVVRATTAEEAAAQAVAVVRGWLAANDQQATAEAA